MPYTAGFYLYLFVAGVVVVVLARLLSPLGLLVNLVFTVAAAYLAIIIGRRVFGPTKSVKAKQWSATSTAHARAVTAILESC
jgi:hypothetical protein